MSEEQQPEQPSPDQKAIEALTAALKIELHKQQDPVYAIVGGLAAALFSAVIWAVITVSTKYQIGYMAIGVGLLVGFSVRYFGAGIDKYFGVIGAFFALVGCALGNLLSQVGFIADSESLGYFETITLLNLDVIIEIYKESFSPMDVVFYGIAAYEGYKFAFRNLVSELAASVEAGRVLPPANARFRLPVVIGLFIGLSVLGYAVSIGSEGLRTFNYESGVKRASGVMSRGKETGPWQSWWENGNRQSEGFYVDGKPDSIWTYYDEEGVLFRKLTFKDGIEHGKWIDYNDDGTVAATGSYQNGRQHGPAEFYSENGKLSSKGEYMLDQPHGPWNYYFENGNPSSSGSYNRGVRTGAWTLWYEDGKKSQELEYNDEGKERILNAWSENGKSVVANGLGTFSTYYAGGQLEQSGKIKDGNKTGVWVFYFEDGSKQSVGEYRDGLFFMTNAWSPQGGQIVKDGSGAYESTYPDGSVSEMGKIEGGLRAGKWLMYFMSSDNVLMEFNYVAGRMEGEHKTYFEDGTVNIEGMMSKDKRTGEWKWYSDDGIIESSVSFIDGKKEGVQSFFDSDGVLIRTETYSNGELIDTKTGS